MLHSNCMCQQHMVPHTPVVAGVHVPWGMYAQMVAQLQASSSTGSASALEVALQARSRQEAACLKLCFWVKLQARSSNASSLHMRSSRSCRGACA